MSEHLLAKHAGLISTTDGLDWDTYFDVLAGDFLFRMGLDTLSGCIQNAPRPGLVIRLSLAFRPRRHG